MDVLVYVMDALRADAVSCYGGPDGDTPELDAFAADAVRYENAYSTATWTKPAATGLLTGRQPRALDVMHRMDRVPSGVEPTLPGVLSAAGFDTHAVSANYFVSEAFGFDWFDEFTLLQRDPAVRERRRRQTDPEMPERDELAHLDLDEIVTPLSADINEALLPRFDGDESVADQSDDTDDTFALAWSIDTHDPFFVRGEASAFGNDLDTCIYADEVTAETLPTVRSLYRDMVRYNDARFGELCAGLRERGRYEDALIVVTADHGESFGDHEKYLGRPITGHNGPVYEEVVHVPLLVKFPGNAHADTTVEEPVQHVDVLPTVTDVCGLERPVGLADTGGDRRSLDPAAGELDEERAIFVESQPTPTSVYSAAVRRGRFKHLEVQKGWPRTLSVRRLASAGLWRLAPPPHGLFDLAADPGEREDVSEDHPTVASALRDRAAEERERLRAAQERVDGERREGIAPDAERQLAAMGYLE